jgi:SAM-dependent methyltransferase
MVPMTTHAAGTESGPESELPEHVRANRAFWDGMADDWISAGERSWAHNDPAWGVFQVPQRDVPFFPEEIEGCDSIELGCGTGYVSAWLARRGARPVGIDNSARQLATARRLQREHGIDFPLLHGDAEHVPYPDASFDLAVSEYGAAVWCDPYAWIPEAARLLRRGGRLSFMCRSIVSALCEPDDAASAPTDRMVRPQRGLHRFTLPYGGVVLRIPHGEMLRLLRTSGFVVEDLIEVYAPDDADDSSFAYAPAAWSRQWPVEEVWKARKA